MSGHKPTANFEAARAFSSPFFDLYPTDRTLADAEASCVSYFADSMVFEKSSFGPMALKRRPSRRFEADQETVTVWLMQSGSHSGIAGETPFHSRPGEVHLLDSGCALEVVAARRQIATLHLPHAVVGYDPRRHPPHLCLPVGTAAARVLSITLQEVFAVLPDTPQVEAAVIASGVAALARGLFQFDAIDEPEREALENARSCAAHKWIDVHLADLSLGAESLCRAFRVSRTTIYRAFTEDGGVDAYIQQKRLERAYDALATSLPARGRVRHIAEQWGFPDPSHFHRCFRARFGVSPSAILGCDSQLQEFGSGPADQPTAARSPVVNWLTRK